MLCSLSGDVARDPVISVKSGHVFERSLLMKHLERTGQDPVSGEDMSPDTDIIAVKTANPIVRPRPTANSLPALINTFQDEWDALMLETYSLRKQLHSTRQELSHALYRYDAACRVIARLKAERDTARSPSAQMDIVEEPASAGTPVVPSELAKSWQLYSEKVSACRKEAFRSPPESLATKEQIGTYEKTSSHALHLVSKPGIMCVDAHAVDPSLIVTGGVDARVVVFDASSEKVRDTLKGHERKVLAVALHNVERVIASGSEDGALRIWKGDDKFKEAAAFGELHGGACTGVAFHGMGRHLATTSVDASWALLDLDESKVVHKFADGTAGYTCGAFHPDGTLFATGTTDSKLVIWDPRENKIAVQPFEGHSGKITSLAFSENGYYMAAGDGDGSAKIWDLRKLKAVHAFASQSYIHSVRFDHTGHYLAIAGDSVRVIEVAKQWTPLVELEGHEKDITGACFGANAQFIASVSLDRHLNLYSAPRA
ncbi:unnamed protein product (mitochondrion) [Plasmodiophora brassicae]|uniref:Pre-mRNA-processing factor 19 n=1 Tax=Plasmodiophora brassicae TaxID=37360 RepID=A0A0G4IX25_PLABS|nr:hypothetical protein PBRA_007637 [Plasmodiophora brassicae]SPQ99535.1 unnamed protein product [Plasmodiophora brassicae]